MRRSRRWLIDPELDCHEKNLHGSPGGQVLRFRFSKPLGAWPSKT